MATDSNVVLHGTPGIGKTTAMVLAMLLHCDHNVSETQILCFTATQEATVQTHFLVTQLSKFTKNTCDTVYFNKPLKINKSHIVVGTSLELAKSVPNMDHVKLICFDDADLTMPFTEVSTKILDKIVNQNTKLLLVSSSLNEVMLRKCGKNVHIFKIARAKLLEMPIRHIIVEVETAVVSKLECLMELLELITSQDRGVIFCMVNFNIRILKLL